MNNYIFKAVTWQVILSSMSKGIFIVTITVSGDKLQSSTLTVVSNYAFKKN